MTLRRLALLAVAALASLAAAPAPDTATELTGLFMQSCLSFTGDAKGLRAWAADNRLPELPAQGEQAFLTGEPGKVFDATDAAGKFVVISTDGGSCSAVAERADGAMVMGDIESALREAGIAFQITNETDDSVEKSLHHREYAASKDGTTWQILVGIVRDKPGPAMLTANPP